MRKLLQRKGDLILVDPLVERLKSSLHHVGETKCFFIAKSGPNFPSFCIFREVFAVTASVRFWKF